MTLTGFHEIFQIVKQIGKGNYAIVIILFIKINCSLT